MRLCALLENYRWANKLTTKELALEIGTTPAILANFIEGKNVSASTLTAILQWLLVDPRLDGVQEQSRETGSAGSCVLVV